MSRIRLPSSPPLSTPVTIVFFLLTNAVFYSTLGSFYLQHRLRHHGQVAPAEITHKWSASRFGDEVYIGYAYDHGGRTHSGSARIRGAGAGLYQVGEALEVMVDKEAPERSLLRDRTHLSFLESISGNLGMVVLTGLFCLFGWWVFVNRVRRRWRDARIGAI